MKIDEFLHCETPIAWLEAAALNLPLILVDHAHCEKKAASTALSLMFRYAERADLVERLSRLAREELRHFEQVLKIMKRRGIQFHHLEPSHYATGLRQQIRTHEPVRLIDTLIVGAYIEARSCERFGKLAPYLDDELAKFYRGLLESEARHFELYLQFAQQFSDEDISQRVQLIGAAEKKLIESVDNRLRFHSGIPLQSSLVELN